MNTHRKRTLVLLIASASLVAAPRQWNKKMQEAQGLMMEIIPLAASSRHLDSAEVKKLTEATKKLVTFSHTINMSPESKSNPLPPDSDPTLPFVSSLFAREIKRAYATLTEGHVEYARDVLKHATGFCIACHTRNDKGPDFPTLDVSPKIAKLPAIERVEIFAAVRQFDRALEEVESILSDTKQASTRPFEWAKALREGLNLAVRVKHDPDRVLALIERAGKAGKIPDFVQENLSAWRASVVDWKAERPTLQNTEEGMYVEAVRLAEAARAKQKYPLDHSADVLFLRASAAVHDFLGKYPDGRKTAEGLLLAGTIYDILQDRLTSPLPEMYYEACVRQMPHSDVAQKCYRQYEASVFFGYSGSGGTAIPEDVQQLMEELRRKAAPEAAPKAAKGN